MHQIDDIIAACIHYTIYQHGTIYTVQHYITSPCKHHAITSYHHDSMHPLYHIAVAPCTRCSAQPHHYTTYPFCYVSITKNWLRYIPIATLFHTTRINIIQLHNIHIIIYTWYDDIMCMIPYFHRTTLHNHTMHWLHSCIK